VGSSGMKKRRKAKTTAHGHVQHMAKVGTHSHDAAVHEQKLERDAAMDVMGLGGVGSGGRTVMWIVFAVIAAVAIIGLLALIVIF
jgi:hypothetical protein